jgi:Secretion system C-terminal sorting domain
MTNGENPNSVERNEPVALGTMKLYPNPATHTLILTIPANYPEQGLSLRITNLMGGTVYNTPLASGLQSLDIPLAGIPSGVYLCSLFDQEKVLETQKVIILR